MGEGDGDHAVVAVGEGHVGGELQETLSAHEIGLEMWSERIATPGHAGNPSSGFAQ